MATQSEVLPPSLTKGEARGLETQAKRHWRTFNRSGQQFAAELRRLQDGEAHIVRGFDQFGDYAKHTFDGLTAAGAKQVSRQGGVLLRLAAHDRIDLEHGRNLPGTTALRALSVALNNRGERDMLAIYDRAVELRPHRSIAESTVKQAMRELVPPPPPAAALTVPVVADDELEDEDDDEDGAVLEEVMDPEDQLEELRQYRDDLDELITARSTSSMSAAQRRGALDHVEYMRRRLEALATQLEDR